MCSWCLSNPFQSLPLPMTLMILSCNQAPTNKGSPKSKNQSIQLFSRVGTWKPILLNSDGFKPVVIRFKIHVTNFIKDTECTLHNTTTSWYVCLCKLGMFQDWLDDISLKQAAVKAITNLRSNKSRRHQNHPKNWSLSSCAIQPPEYAIPATALSSQSQINWTLSPLPTASIKVRNWGLGSHADQTDEMVRD